MFDYAKSQLQVILQSDAVLDDSQELDIECRKRTERSDARVITK